MKFSFLFVFVLVSNVIAGETSFFSQQTLNERFYQESYYYDHFDTYFEVGDLIFADKNNDGEFYQYRVKAILPNGNLIATVSGSTKAVQLNRNSVGKATGRLLNRLIYGDRNRDGEYVQYRIVGKLQNGKILVKEVGYNTIYAGWIRDYALATRASDIVYLDRNNDNEYVQYVIKGLFHNGDVIVNEVGYNTFYRNRTNTIGMGYHWLVGQEVYGDYNNDGEYVPYVIKAALPNGKLIAKESGYNNYRPFNPGSLGYSSSQTAYDVFRMISDNLYLIY